MSTVIASIISAIALTSTVSCWLPKDKTPVIVNSFEYDYSRRPETIQNQFVKEQWENAKSNGQIDFTNVTFIPVKYKTFNELLPSYIPDFLLIKPVPQEGVDYAKIELKINDTTFILTPSMK